LRRSIKLYARGDGYRARRLLIDGVTNLRVGSPPLPDLGDALDRLADRPSPIEPLPEPVSVIVPIHNGREHLRRLFATLFAHTEPRHPIVLANDGSTDLEIAPLLAEAALENPNVKVVTSTVNRGFVATINQSMQATSGHVAILNSDTEVPAGWLERLLQPILSGGRIASTSPFSNAAAIFSFPTPNVDHELPDGLSLAEVDAAFARLVPTACAEQRAPATMGFCMGINRSAWDSCGEFDEATFGRGYCEETDWCLRAAAHDWRSVLVPNLFVYHVHGGTFANRERKRLLEGNYRTLHRRWPGYYRELAAFRRRDPWASYRAAAFLAMPHSAVRADSLGDSGLRVQVERGSWQMELSATSPRELDRLRALTTSADGSSL
jgi:GT2 family glycosyltransferase